MEFIDLKTQYARYKTAIDANMEKPVIVKGKIEKAEWSRSGKVMNIDFADAKESGLLDVATEGAAAAAEVGYIEELEQDVHYFGFIGGHPRIPVSVSDFWRRGPQ